MPSDQQHDQGGLTQEGLTRSSSEIAVPPPFKGSQTLHALKGPERSSYVQVSMPGNQQHDQGRLAQEGLRSQNASPAPGALRRQNSTGLASPQGSHRSPLDDMFAPGAPPPSRVPTSLEPCRPLQVRSWPG